MKIIKIIGSIFLILFGVFIFIYGGYDDSPGAQLLGLILFIIGIFNLIKGKKIITLVIVLIIAIAGIFLFFSKFQKQNNEFSSIEDKSITYNNSSADLIKVELPFPGAVTGKSFSVIGEARGTWFFEASFPVQLFDKDGELLATAIAQAQEDWMTEEFVPFKADIVAPESYIGEATLVLKKDNPSGLPNKDASISFKITVEY